MHFSTNLYGGIRDVLASVYGGLCVILASVYTGLRDVSVSVYTGLRDVSVSVYTGLRDVLVSVYTGLRDVLEGVEGGKVEAALVDVNLAMYSTDIIEGHNDMMLDEMVENSKLLAQTVLWLTKTAARVSQIMNTLLCVCSHRCRVRCDRTEHVTCSGAVLQPANVETLLQSLRPPHWSCWTIQGQ